MFVWNEEQYGVRPTEGNNGSFGGRETRLAPCDCPANNAVYVDNGEPCYEQSAALHAEFGGYPDVETLVADMERVSMADVIAEMLAKQFIASVIEAGLQSQMPAGVRVRVVTPEELMMLGLGDAIPVQNAPDEDLFADWTSMFSADVPEEDLLDVDPLDGDTHEIEVFEFADDDESDDELPDWMTDDDDWLAEFADDDEDEDSES